jgi:hypothetical protein
MQPNLFGVLQEPSIESGAYWASDTSRPMAKAAVHARANVDLIVSSRVKVNDNTETQFTCGLYSRFDLT